MHADAAKHSSDNTNEQTVTETLERIARKLGAQSKHSEAARIYEHTRYARTAFTDFFWNRFQNCRTYSKLNYDGTLVSLVFLINQAYF